MACKSYSLVAVAFFVPGRVKDLSAPPYKNLWIGDVLAGDCARVVYKNVNCRKKKILE